MKIFLKHKQQLFNQQSKLNLDMPEIIKEKIMTVTKEDIQKLASKIYIDTVFLLGGDKK